jgi:hypothetical protein
MSIATDSITPYESGYLLDLHVLCSSLRPAVGIVGGRTVAGCCPRTAGDSGESCRCCQRLGVEVVGEVVQVDHRLGSG